MASPLDPFLSTLGLVFSVLCGWGAELLKGKKLVNINLIVYNLQYLQRQFQLVVVPLLRYCLASLDGLLGCRTLFRTFVQLVENWLQLEHYEFCLLKEA